MKTDFKYSGLVTKKFNEFFLVDLINDKNLENKNRFLCKVKKSVNFLNQHIYVGDEVVIDQIDLKRQRARIENLIKRKNLLERPSVANLSNIYVVCSVEEPKLNLN